MKKIGIVIVLFCCSVSVFGQQPKDSTINYQDITGKKQGYWKKTDASGTLLYEGYFKNDMPVGEFKKYHPNGRVKHVMYYNPKDPKDVQVTMYDITGELSAKGNYYNKNKHGTWLYYGQQAQLLLEENYNMGKLDGAATVFWQNEQNLPAEVKHWKDSVKHGDWFWFYENGQMRMKARYSSNKLDGAFIVYFVDGKIHINGNYVNDHRHGAWKYFNEDGTIRYDLQYNMGVLTNQDEFDKQQTIQINKMMGDIPNFTEPDMTDPNVLLDTVPANYPKDPNDPQNYLDNPEAYIFGVQLPEDAPPAQKSKKKKQKTKK